MQKLGGGGGVYLPLALSFPCVAGEGWVDKSDDGAMSVVFFQSSSYVGMYF
jgi:hypothetical protein